MSKVSSLINQYNRSYVEQMYVIMICYFFIHNKWILIDLCQPRMYFNGYFFVLIYYLPYKIELCYWNEKRKKGSVCLCVSLSMSIKRGKVRIGIVSILKEFSLKYVTFLSCTTFIVLYLNMNAIIRYGVVSMRSCVVISVSKSTLKSV